MARLAVAALSARALTEAARRDGHEVMALDLFGDRDTRAASLHWAGLGGAGSLRVEPEYLLSGLQRAADQGATAWVMGSGFEGMAPLLAQAETILPRWGVAVASVAAVRDPHTFFAALRGFGIAHPEVCLQRPEKPEGWLHKNAHSCGGWQVHPAQADDHEPPPPGHYWQRDMPGRAMSMTLLADGQRAAVLGVNEQWVAALQGRPYVFAGVVGPVKLEGRWRSAVQGIGDRLVRHFELRGLCGVDFLLHNDDILVLEVNPRPPASHSLYGRQGGLFNAHLQACQHGRLPRSELLVALQEPGAVRALQYLLARRRLNLTVTGLAHLAAWPGAHDVAAEPLSLGPGDPVCTLTAQGDDPAQLRQRLARTSDTLLNDLETWT